ncbi:hypothetical protein ABMA27_007306 [Loxostege sticticalis]|uniref:Uncharacterized protein n=1 Tax=Loxostege sticticalis TaxID=481309 RepID=A0ABR3HEY6_LOXSC
MGGYSSKDETVISQAQATASGGSATTFTEITRTEIIMCSVCLIFIVAAVYYTCKRCMARGRRAVAKELGRIAEENGIVMTQTAAPATPATPATPAARPTQVQAQINPAFIP